MILPIMKRRNEASVVFFFFFNLKKMDKVYKIEPVPTSKDDIKHPPLSEAGVIPKLNSSTILVGKSGSGKSVLLHNLLTRKEFF